MTGPVGVSVLPQPSTTVGGTGCTISAGQATVEAPFAGTVKVGYAGTVKVEVQIVVVGAQLLVYVNTTVRVIAVAEQMEGAPWLSFVSTPLQPPVAVALASQAL